MEPRTLEHMEITWFVVFLKLFPGFHISPYFPIFWDLSRNMVYIWKIRKTYRKHGTYGKQTGKYGQYEN